MARQRTFLLGVAALASLMSLLLLRASQTTTFTTPEGMAVWTGEPSFAAVCPAQEGGSTAYAVPLFGSGSAHIVAVCLPCLPHCARDELTLKFLSATGASLGFLTAPSAVLFV